MQENYAEFQKEFKKLTQSYGLYSFGKNEFEKCQQAHQKLRKVIKGLEVNQTVKLVNSIKPADKQEGLKLIDKLIDMHPDIKANMSFNYLNKEDFLYPTVRVGSHSGMRTSKYFSRYFYGASSKENKILSDLGKLWAKAKTSQVALETTLSTKAIDFLKLGHYGEVDKDSCFKNGNGGSDKTNLALSGNSYVITFKEKDKIVARSWGFANKEFQVFNNCNLYLTEGTKEGNVIAALKQLFGNILNTNPERVNVLEHKIGSVGNVYLNNYGLYSFTTKKDIGYQVIEEKFYDADEDDEEGDEPNYDYDDDEDF